MFMAFHWKVSSAQAFKAKIYQVQWLAPKAANSSMKC